jgi:PAS domain S-box-containing protein
VGSLILTTGGVVSPFIALWMLVSIFAGLFGVWGLLPMIASIGSFVAVEYLNQHFTPELIVLVSFAGVLPLVASFIVWRSKTGKSEDGSDRAYKDLAHELSQVATQSEVVINAIGDGVMAIDGVGTIQLINPAAQRVLGWSKQDALALSYKSVLRLIDRTGKVLDTTIDPVQQVLNNNQQVRNNDLNITSKNGKKMMASIVVSPIGEIGSGVIIVFRDITKEKAEEREQAEFISTASHEMRTPVASIEGYLGLALNPNTAQIDDKARNFILKAHEAAQHLGHLFQDLLDVSKADDRRLANNPKVIDMMIFTHDIVQGFQQKADEKGLQLTFKPNPDDGGRHVTPVYNVNLDNDHIREIIDNLTENAIKYTPEGEVIVDVTGSEDKVVISIKDSGIGIPNEDIPHLFQKFYRVDNVDTREIGGTGLGLYLCRRLAETMGGRLWVESEYKKGSTFFVELPRIDTQDASDLVEQQTLAAQKAASQTTAQQTTTPVFDPNQQPKYPSPTIEPIQSATNPTSVKAATTVPRGESLTPEQIAAHVAQLKAMIQEQAQTNPQPIPTPVITQPISQQQSATERPPSVQ